MYYLFIFFYIQAEFILKYILTLFVCVCVCVGLPRDFGGMTTGTAGDGANMSAKSGNLNSI